MQAADIGVVIVAGGQGLRLGRDVPKQFLQVGGKELFRYSLDHFLQAQKNLPDFAGAKIVLVLPADMILVFHQLYPMYSQPVSEKKLSLTAGGATRAESVRNGMLQLTAPTFVLVHDAARPFFSTEKIQAFMTRLVQLSRENLLLSGRWARDTILTSDIQKQRLMEVVDRERVFQAETPQGFYLQDYENALARIQRPSLDFTDESSLFLESGMGITPFALDSWNPKITFAEDLDLMKAYLRYSHE